MRWVVGGAVVLSVATNVYLLAFDSTGSPETRPKTSRLRLVRSQRAPVPVIQPRAVPDEVARLDRKALEARLVAAEAKLEKTLPLELKFARSEPAPEVEIRLQPALDKLFDGDEYTLECRGRVCKIGSRSENDWRMSVQTDPSVAGMFRGMSVGREIMAEVEEVPRASAINTVVKPIYELQASPRLEGCKREHAGGEGTLWLSIQIEARRFVVKANGPFAGQAVGVCIRRLLEDLAAATPIPPEVTSTEEIPFPVPL